jgi:hypothetical protein
MADISTNTVMATSAGNPIIRAFSWVGNLLVKMAEANPRMRQAEALAALSDQDLAKRGLRRQDIAMHVFGDWI